jgi:hypothetical protein
MIGTKHSEIPVIEMREVSGESCNERVLTELIDVMHLSLLMPGLSEENSQSPAHLSLLPQAYRQAAIQSTTSFRHWVFSISGPLFLTLPTLGLQPATIILAAS